MNPKNVHWTLKEVCEMSLDRLGNKKDAIICITGARGEGKSTFAYKKAIRLKLTFNPKKDILYSIDDVLIWYSKNKNRICIFDEAIAIHNREFFAKIQKKLIKILNMYRDSCNVLILCIPNFNNLDTQVRQLVRIRFHIISRGMGVMLLPKLGIHNKDIWETEKNSRIENYYNSKKKKVPYSSITTFAGFIAFDGLTVKQDEIYSKVKEEKRNVVFGDDIHEAVDPVSNIYNLLINNKLTKEGFEGACLSMNMKLNTARIRMARMLKDDGKDTKLKPLYRE